MSKVNLLNQEGTWRYFISGVMTRKIQKKIWTTLKQDLLKGSRERIVWK